MRKCLQHNLGKDYYFLPLSQFAKIRKQDRRAKMYLKHHLQFTKKKKKSVLICSSRNLWLKLGRCSHLPCREQHRSPSPCAPTATGRNGNQNKPQGAEQVYRPSQGKSKQDTWWDQFTRSSILLKESVVLQVVVPVATWPSHQKVLQHPWEDVPLPTAEGKRLSW